MRLISEGSFLMGSNHGGQFESPVHKVYIDAFLMDITPVTNAQFRRFVDDTGYRTQVEQVGYSWGYKSGEFCIIDGLSWRSFSTLERDEHPVVLVSWEDANTFASWSGKRLPTEAEWEYAARGSHSGKLYPWGDQEPDGSQCNFANKPNEIPPTREVTNFEPNSFGLFDMVGNVWQWCSDWYSDDFYSKSDSMKNPLGPVSGEFRVRRGGSWNVIQPFRLRCANRGAVKPDMAVPNMGFRCALSIGD